MEICDLLIQLRFFANLFGGQISFRPGRKMVLTLSLLYVLRLQTKTTFIKIEGVTVTVTGENIVFIHQLYKIGQHII